MRLIGLIYLRTYLLDLIRLQRWVKFLLILVRKPIEMRFLVWGVCLSRKLIELASLILLLLNLIRS
ncbi:hypothetical protein U724_23900 [Pseudomonas chlororaphis subsp. aurantiaca PB-St2]|nr:hypothetical protein U724_23900 [Pseudomonas chlororaphis subsp. aurantiaca PB-St2]